MYAVVFVCTLVVQIIAIEKVVPIVVRMVNHGFR